MAERIDIIFNNAISVSGFFEEQVGRDVDDIDSIVDFNLAKITLQMRESSQDVVSTVDRANDFQETAIFGARLKKQLDEVVEKKDESDDSENAANEKSVASKSVTYSPKITSKEAALKNNQYKGSTDPVKDYRTGSANTNTPREIQIGYSNKISGEFNIPDNEAGKNQFKENIKADWKDFKATFDLTGYASDFRAVNGIGSNDPRLKNAPQNYVAAAAEKLKYNSLGQRHSRDPKKYILEECIPCADRILALGDLLAFPSDFLDLLEQDVFQKLQDLKRIFDLLLKPPLGYYDLCELLRFLSFQCVPDLAAMALFLVDFLKEYLVLKGLTNNFGLAVNELLSAIMSPFLMGLNSMLDSYIDLIFAPIDCILDALTNQLRKLDVVGAAGTATSGYSRDSIEKAMGSFSPNKFKNDLHKSFNQGYKNSQETLKNKDFPEENAFQSQRPLLATFEAIGTGLGFLFNSLLFARDWFNSKLETARKAVTDFISRSTKARNQGLGYLELVKQIAFILKILNTMIRLINKKAFICQTDQDVVDFMNELENDGSGGFTMLPRNDFPPQISNNPQPTDLPGVDDIVGAVIPISLVNNITIYNGQPVVEKEIPNFGTIRTPVKFIRKCSGSVSLGDDEKVKKWLESLKKTRL